MDALVPQCAKVGWLMDEKIRELEERIAHQDAAIDELTTQTLLQQRLINELISHMEKLQSQVKALAEGGQGDIVDAPPPHY